MADLVVSLWTAVLICTTMWPFMSLTGRILMQLPPPHLSAALDRAIAEVVTAVDGVLECQEERFWQLGFPSTSSSAGTMGHRCLAGALRVRARRDADERVVVRGVTARLSHLVSHLTVHVFKDDYALATTPSAFGGVRSLIVPSPSVPLFPDVPTAVVVSPVPSPVDIYGPSKSGVSFALPHASMLHSARPTSPEPLPVQSMSVKPLDSRVAHRAFIVAPSGQYSRRYPVV